MAEPDPAGIGGMLGGGEESSPIFRGQTEVKIEYKDVTGLTKQMTALADAIKKVHTALGTLDDAKSRKALANLKGIGGSGAGGANGSADGKPAFSGDEKPGSGQGGNGGFTGITRRQYAIGSVFAGASLLAGAYDRRMQGDLSSDVLAMRTVYTSDRPSFGLREATSYNASRFGPYSLGREDAQQGAAATMGRYGAPFSRGAEAAARGVGTLSMGSLQGSAYGAEMYNALNSPDVLNRMRMFTGYSTGQVTNVTDFNSRMAKAVFNSATPTNAQLNGLRPGTPGYESLLMLSGGNQGLMQTQVELMRARQRYQAMGSPKGPWNDELVRNIAHDKGLQKDLFGGENSLFLSRQKFEAGKGMRQEELLNMSRSGLVTTNELLATISSNTFELTKHFEKFLGPLGNLLGGLGGGMGAFGQATNLGMEFMQMRALTNMAGGKGGPGLGGGFQLGGFLKGGGIRGGLQAAGGRGALGLLARGAGIAGLGAMGGQFIDDMIGNPKDKEGVDAGNILRYGATGAGIGAAVGGPWGAAIGGGAGLVYGGIKEFFGGDPIDTMGRGGVGDPPEKDQPMPGGGMSVSEAEELLRSRGGHTSGIAGLAADFKVKLGQLFKMNPRLSLSSGARSSAEQARLYDRWVRKVPGQAPAAKPGTSNHEFGLAADIGPSSEYGWLAAHAPQVGLVKPMSYEPWHWEPPGAKSRRGKPVDEGAGGGADTGQSAIKPSVLAAAVERVTGIGGNKAGKPPGAPQLSGVAITSAGEGLSVEGTGATGGGGAGAPWKGGAGSISINDAARAARAAGVPEDQIALAVALGMAESSLNPRAHNAKPPDDSYGIWQINMLGKMGPDRRKSLGINSNDALFDPNVNAKAMAMISGGGHNWRPWSTYTSGAYKGHMASVESALKSGVGDPVEMGPSGQHDASMAPMITLGGGQGGGGPQIVAPIYVTVQNASDEEAQRFARRVKAHLEGIVADIDNTRAGV